MDKLRNILAVVLAIGMVSCSACSLVTKMNEEDKVAKAMSTIPEAELNQDPQFGELPDNAGWLFAMKFTRPLTEQQASILLGSGIMVVRLNNRKTDGKVVIFAYISTEKSVSVAADYGKNEIEFWETDDRETYTKRTYEGDPDTVLQYLAEGISCGNPKVETGRIEDEGKPHLGSRQGL